MGLDLETLSVVNRLRANRWHDGFGYRSGNWSGADWSNAMVGEAGEAANVVKKLRRFETGHRGQLDPDDPELRMALGAELADTIIYADLVATYYGIDLSIAIMEKFNAVSEREGFPERLDFG